MTAHLLDYKTRYSKRRKITAFIIIIVALVALMNGSSAFYSDNFKHSAVGNRICMYDTVPTDGSSPADHDLISNAKFAAEKLYSSHYFIGNSLGTIVADLGMGLSYKQTVHNTRVVKGDKIFTESISSSWAKSVAEQKYIWGSKVLYRPAEKVSSDSAVFSDSVKDISKDFGALYGLIPNEIAKQVISVEEDPDKDYGVTVLSCSDDNADTVNDNGQYPFVNPDKLVKGGDGFYAFTLTLDPVQATLYSRNEVRTLGGAPQNPDYSSNSGGKCVLTFVIDDEWNPVSVTVKDKYGIEIVGLGAIVCDSVLTETFSDIGNHDIILPEQEFFESHINDAGSEIEKKELEPSDYLMNAFGKYITGDPLNLKADIAIGDTKLSGVAVSLNLSDMDVKASYGALGVNYTDSITTGKSGKLLYITLNDVKGYLSLDDLTGLMRDPTVNQLTSLLKTSITLPDFSTLNGEEIMGNMTVTKTKLFVTIHAPITVGDITINADIKLKNNEAFDLVSINAAITAFGKNITAYIEPAKNLTFATPSPDYTDLSPVIDTVLTALSTVINHDAYGVNGSVTFNCTTIGLDAYITRDEFTSASVEGNLSAFSQNVELVYLGDTLYCSLANIGIKATKDEIPALINEVAKQFNIDLGSLDAVKDFLPSTPAQIINMMQSVNCDDGLTINLEYMSQPISVTLKTASKELSAVNLKVNVDLLGIKLDADVNLNITTQNKRDITPKNINYVEAAEIVEVLPPALDLINAEAFAVTGDATVQADDTVIKVNDVEVGIDKDKNVFVTAKVKAFDQIVDVAYVNGVAYIKYDDVRFKLATSDLNEVMTCVTKVAAALGYDVALPDLSNAKTDTSNLITTILNGIKNVDFKGGVASVHIAIDDVTADITFDINGGNASVNAAYKNVKIAFKGKIAAATKTEIIKTVSGDYTDVKRLLPLINAVTPLLPAKGLDLGLSLNASGVDITGDVSVAFPTNDEKFGFKARLNAADVPLTVTYAYDKIYVDINNGNIALYSGTSKQEIDDLLTSVASAVPQLQPVIDDVKNLTSDTGKLDINDFDFKSETTTQGFTVSVKNNDVAIKAEIVNDGDVISAIKLNCKTQRSNKNDLNVTLNLGCKLNGGALQAISVNDYGTITVNSTAKQNITVTGVYTPITMVTDYLAPVMEIAKGFSALSFNLNGYVMVSENKRLSVAGSVMINPNPLEVYAKIDVLGSNVYLTVTHDVLYVKLGEIKLKVDLSGDTAKNDLGRLINVLSEYLPEYLTEEIKIAFGITKGDPYLQNDTTRLLDKIKELTSALTAQEAVDVLFGNLNSSSTVAKALLDMVSVYTRNDALTLDLSVFGVDVTVTPRLTASKNAINDVTLETSLQGKDVRFNLSGLNFAPVTVTAPADDESYISLLDYVDLINGVAHTFTTKNADGDITFVVDTFDLNFKQDDKITTNDDGTTTEVGKTITIKNDGTALKGILKANGDKYDINLEAHLILGGVSDNAGDISLGLYLLTDYDYNGVNYDEVGYLTYKEGKTGYGENVSIDYGSVMQILCSVFKILNVDESTINKIIPAAYRVRINSGVFASMDIAGLDSLKDTIDGVVNTVLKLEDAASDLKQAWDLIKAPDSLNASQKEKIDMLINSSDEIKAHVSDAIGRFKSNTQAAPQTSVTEVEVPKFSDVVNGIKLTKQNDMLGASVSNALTTKGSGDATLLVSQGVNNQNENVLSGLKINNLDVDGAVINSFEANLKAGCPVTIAPDMDGIINVTDGANKTTYNDLSDIKHLLFDILNTANLFEYEIGADANDSIKLTIDLGSLINLGTMNIKYDIKVKLYDKQQRLDLGLINQAQFNDKAEPEYKAIAYVELIYRDVKAVGGLMTIIDDCTTRLYFYDNVLYVDGIKLVKTTKKVWYGTKVEVTPENVKVKYTVEKFLDTIGNDTAKFLNEFVFYLMPLSRNILTIDLQQQITDMVTKDGDATSTATPTIATVFKGYSYDNGSHNVKIGLKELAGNDMLKDVDVSLVGANNSNDDKSILDNYVSSASIKTSMSDFIHIALTASLNNASYDPATETVSSSGLSPTTVNGNAYNDLISLLRGVSVIGDNSAWQEIW